VWGELKSDIDDETVIIQTCRKEMTEAVYYSVTSAGLLQTLKQ